ncbi:MAG: 16S rRNA (guanine(527)-N(7))-methyltransferase RsmG [Clostridia bacterium]|nr:16S rRNA (guanine(527)-N(7))-methyltransferase RsmG [Clostridia bacterium]
MILEGYEQFSEKFREFNGILTEFNQKYNLTAISDEKEVYIKHFFDSIQPQKYFPTGAKVVEIGSGGGFPSVPLKIVRDDLSFTLIESTGKKCEYLRHVVDKLGFNGVQVLNIRAEDGGKDKNLREKFDVATARAVARLNTLCEYCLPFVKIGGRFIAYKGDADEEINESLNAIKTLGGEIEKIEKYDLPEGFGKRTVIVIKKVKSTPEKYPRGRGLERKKPL